MKILFKYKGFLILVILGSLLWSLTMVKSGWLYGFGFGFWGPNGHDGVWHLAIINQLSKGNFQMPVYAGEFIANYHIGFDFVVAMLHKISALSVVVLYFQIMPILMSVAIGLFVYFFVLAWKKSTLVAFWSTFFVYFGGSWGWLVGFFRTGKFGGESMFWAQQSVSTLINPPFAMSLVIIFGGLYILQKYVSTREKRYAILSTFLFGILIQIKVYAGILVIGGLFVAGFYEFVVKRNGIWLFKIFSGTLILSLLLFLPMNAFSGSSIVFKPFWFLETMMQISDRVNWQRFGEAMVNYRLGNVWWKAIPAYIFSFVVFWYGNMGTRLISEFYIAKRFVERKIEWLDLFIFSVVFAGGLIPLFFVQKGTPWNTIQFFYYSLVFSGILAGIVFGDWIGNNYRKKYDVSLHHTKALKMLLGVAVFVLLTIPTSLITLIDHYLPTRPPAKLSNEEILGLSFLAGQPDGVVLTFPFDKKLAKETEDDPPRPLYLYESTAYVSAFSNKTTFLEDEVNLNITGYAWPDRRQLVESFYTTSNKDKARSFLQENDIKYVYWVDGQRAVLGEKQLGIEKIFENKEVDIYKVN